MMLLGLGIAGVSEIVGAYGGRKCSEDFADCDADGFGRARGRLAQQVLELGEDLFDRFRSGEYFGTATLPSPPWNELARLNLADIDLQVGTITVKETKFFKSRILPLADSALSALREYLEARRKAKVPQSPESGLFWHDQGHARHTSHAIAGCLVDILRRAGIKPAKGKIGPRIHDLRHSFVGEPHSAMVSRRHQSAGQASIPRRHI